MSDKFPINIWINEERYEKLSVVGLEKLTEDMLAGMKVLRIYCNEAQKDKLLALYPMAKYDSATTKSIELLPAEVKDKMLETAIDKQSVDIMADFLQVG